jgi:hypothetical protein
MHTNDSDLAVLYALRVRATVPPVCGWRRILELLAEYTGRHAPHTDDVGVVDSWALRFTSGSPIELRTGRRAFESAW